MSRSTSALGLYCLLLAASSASASSNLLINPEFSIDLSGWRTESQGGGAAFWNGSVGYPAPGSLILSAPSANTSASIFQCVPVAAPEELRFDFRSYTAISNGTGKFVPSLKAYASEDCTGVELAELFSGKASYPGSYAQWNQASAVLPAGTLSLRVRIDASVAAAGGQDEVRFDHFLLAPAELVFEDSLETE